MNLVCFCFCPILVTFLLFIYIILISLFLVYIYIYYGGFSKYKSNCFFFSHQDIDVHNLLFFRKKILFLIYPIINIQNSNQPPPSDQLPSNNKLLLSNQLLNNPLPNSQPINTQLQNTQSTINQ